MPARRGVPTILRPEIRAPPPAAAPRPSARWAGGARPARPPPARGGRPAAGALALALDDASEAATFGLRAAARRLDGPRRRARARPPRALRAARRRVASVPGRMATDAAPRLDRAARGFGSPRPLRAALAVGLVAGCTLALQVLLTRVLSAVLAYHFSFLAISLALLGVGAGALAVYLRGSWFEGPLEALLARWAAVLAVALALMPLALVRLDYSSGIGADITADFVLTLALVCVLAALPFLAAGRHDRARGPGLRATRSAVCTPSTSAAPRSARIVVVPLLWVVSGTTLLVGPLARRRARPPSCSRPEPPRCAGLPPGLRRSPRWPPCSLPPPTSTSCRRTPPRRRASTRSPCTGRR